ncbi:uncharacterized protein LOC120216460 [Hibiscus syriacus]|uniref:uncharacterized protein LOC120216460 n=1 Tax=Hibiscus syriacus TaxID=106335 RepID=UPI0019215033|nr:uncharacterized protein LOC120216460 [Hibiscus syriacus]
MRVSKEVRGDRPDGGSNSSALTRHDEERTPQEVSRKIKGEGDDHFSVKSCLRILLDNLDDSFFWSRHVWSGVAPPRVESFVWQVVYKKVAIKVDLIKRGVQGIEDPSCPFCGLAQEAVFHLFVSCKVSWGLWPSRDPFLADHVLNPDRIPSNLVSWSLPPIDFVKVNVDGAMDRIWLKGGIDGLLRDEKGMVLGSFSERVGSDPLILAELLAIKRCLLLFLESGMSVNRRLILESDSAMVVDWIKNPTATTPFFFSIVKDIASIMVDKGVIVRHVLRAANWEVDEFAKSGIG